MDSLTFRPLSTLFVLSFAILSLMQTFSHGGQIGLQSHLAGHSLALDPRQVTRTIATATTTIATTINVANMNSTTTTTTINSSAGFISSSTSSTPGLDKTIQNLESTSSPTSSSSVLSVSSISVKTSTSSAFSPVASPLTPTEASSSSSASTSTSSTTTSSAALSSTATSQFPSTQIQSTGVSRTGLPITIPLPGPSEVSTPLSTPPPSSAVNESSGASHSGFWQSKPAVAGTFAAVALVVIGMFVAAGVILVRNRRRRELADEEFFVRFPEPELRYTGNFSEPGVAEMVAQTPMSAHATHDVLYSTAQPFGGGDYQIGYPPETSYSAAQHVGSYHSDYIQNPPEERVEPRTHPLASHPDIQQRNSGYSPSIDSFYGVQGAPTAHAV